MPNFTIARTHFGDPAGLIDVSVPNDRVHIVRIIGLPINGCDGKASLPGKNSVSLAVAVDPNEANIKIPAI